MRKQLMILFMCILLVGVVTPALTTLGTFEAGKDIKLIQLCADCTYTNITSVGYPNSTSAISNIEMTKSGTEFYYILDSDYTNPVGTYTINGVGDIGGTDTIWAYTFEVTPNGQVLTSGQAFINIGLLSILIIFLIGCVAFFLHGNNLLVKVGTLGFGYLLLIAITFISWNMASDFLLSAPFVASMLRILFFVLMAGLFPLLLGSFGWYFFMLFRIKEIQSLMDKGMDMDEAEKRVKGRKYK